MRSMRAKNTIASKYPRLPNAVALSPRDIRATAHGKVKCQNKNQHQEISIAAPLIMWYLSRSNLSCKKEVLIS